MKRLQRELDNINETAKKIINKMSLVKDEDYIESATSEFTQMRRCFDDILTDLEWSIREQDKVMEDVVYHGVAMSKQFSNKVIKALNNNSNEIYLDNLRGVLKFKFIKRSKFHDGSQDRELIFIEKDE